MKNAISNILKGFFIGGTLTVPGVSGGSMAMILGLYDKLIHSVNSLFRRSDDKKECLIFLLEMAVGGLCGILLLSNAVVFLMESFPSPVKFFFIGTVAGGIPVIFKAAKIKRPKCSDFFYLLSGVLVVVLLDFLPPGLLSANNISGLPGFMLQILGGFIAAMALVFPGISVSHMLYMLGLYETIMKSISTFQIIALIPFGIGMISGVILTSRIMEYIIIKFQRATYLTILGFVIGSVFQLLSGTSYISSPIICVAMTFIGFIGIYIMFRAESKN